MTTWVIISWVAVAILTAVNIFVFLKLKKASDMMRQMMAPGSKDMNEAMSMMQKNLTKMGGRGPMRGVKGMGMGRKARRQEAQLQQAMDMLKRNEALVMNEIQKLEFELYELTNKLNKLKREAPRTEVPHYEFDSLDGKVALKDLFAGKDKLLMIHNMGQGCRYCTIWADGLNPWLPHLETAMSVVMCSKDDVHTQRAMANDRGWRFRTVSHGGGAYMTEQTVMKEGGNYPGAVLYEREGDKVFRKNVAVFGPGDLYCSLWNFLGLAGLGEDEWTPQYHYWKRPSKMDDGGKNLN